jgi:hypothetical protein
MKNNKNRLATICAIIAFLALTTGSLAACQSPEESDDRQIMVTSPVSRSSQVGDIVDFGGHEWRVLEVKDGKALLLSEYLLGTREFNEGTTDVTWAECDLRAYLNGEFLERFGAGYRACIIETRNSNQDNQWSGTSGGEDTDDYVFLLSLEEVVKYFGDSGQLAKQPTDRDGFEAASIDDRYNEARIAYFKNRELSMWWWLRSPGRLSDQRTSVQYNGYILVNGFEASGMEGGIRPAMWLDLAMAEVALPSPNDILKFGPYHWLVLEVSDGKALLLSQYVHEQRAYNGVWDDNLSYAENVAATATTWAECDLRAYLNGEFLNNFSAEDRERIALTRVSTPDNQWFGSPGGEVSDDFIFLLSVEEVVKYFGDSGDLANRKAWRIDSDTLEFVLDSENGSYINDQFNEARIGYNPTPFHQEWWLRSPGHYPFLDNTATNWAVLISSDGAIVMGGSQVDSTIYYVRPALWLKLDYF